MLMLIFVAAGAALGWYGASQGHIQGEPIKMALMGAVAGFVLWIVLRIALKFFWSIVWIAILAAVAWFAYTYLMKGRV